MKTHDQLPLGTIRTFKYDEVVSFCEVRKQWGDFSNMSKTFPVEFQGAVYPTSEHLYISGLFIDFPDIQSEIREHANAMYCKRKYRSRAFLPFCRTDWNEVNIEWMKLVLNLKYQQNPGFRKLLESTGDKIILEDSTMHMSTDPYGGHSSFFWGAKDLTRRAAIKQAQNGLRRSLKNDGCGKAHIKKKCNELKEKLSQNIPGEFIGANVMGLLLTELRNTGYLKTIFLT